MWGHNTVCYFHWHQSTFNDLTWSVGDDFQGISQLQGSWVAFPIATTHRPCFGLWLDFWPLSISSLWPIFRAHRVHGRSSSSQSLFVFSICPFLSQDTFFFCPGQHHDVPGISSLSRLLWMSFLEKDNSTCSFILFNYRPPSKPGSLNPISWKKSNLKIILCAIAVVIFCGLNFVNFFHCDESCPTCHGMLADGVDIFLS